MVDFNFKVDVQRALPQHLLSRLAGQLASSEWVWLKRLLIQSFLRSYSVNLDEAEFQNPDDYRSFNHFFTRQLLPNARVADPKATWVVPVDGIVSSVQPIQSDSLYQAKGKSFSLKALLADPDLTDSFSEGWATVFYLAPYHYHRVHAPVDATLLKSIYVPGKLFSVNTETVSGVDELFARNERLICLFDTPHGRMVIVMVGAMLVGSMQSVWKKEPYVASQLFIEHHRNTSVTFKKMDEIGYFQMGSTVIVLTSNPNMKPVNHIEAGSSVCLGQAFTA